MAVMLLSTSLFAQKFTTINGIASDFTQGDEVILQIFKDGKFIDYARTLTSKEGGFGFTIVQEEEGFINIKYQLKEFEFYTKPGDNLNVEIDFKNVSFQLFGKNTKENLTIQQWKEYFKPIIIKSKYYSLDMCSYDTFFPLYTEKYKGIEAFMKSVKTGNDKFDHLMKFMIETDAEYYGILFLNTPRKKHPQANEIPAFYQQFKTKENLNNEELLLLPNGLRKIVMYCQQYCKVNKVEFSDTMDASLAIIGNDKIKCAYLVTKADFKNFAAYQAFETKYAKVFNTPELKKQLDEITVKYANYTTGDKAPDFTYPDATGKMVSLSSFKGKVVLIDVWATWCGPCMKEVPYLVKLEKELHANKEIVFVGISIDEEKDKQKWMNTLKEKNLEGIQLFAAGWSKITKDYKIKGIPRFIVIDKKGNIHALEAPRPSNPALKTMLLNLSKQ